MHSQIKHICIFILLILCVSSYYVIPLRAGTIQITDSDFRQQKIIKKMINLNLTKAKYQSQKDTNVIASITSLSMDDKLNFHFGYKIICPADECFLNFTLIRYTQVMNTQFKYHIVADYLVARGLKTIDLNMTSFQQHMFMGQVVSYNQKNQKQKMDEKLPFNNEDAMYMLLFPTGFNNLTLTGHVLYNYILQTDMYVVHYMDHSGNNSQNNYMGFGPDQTNYIRYRALFIPQNYLTQYQGCQTVQNFKLAQHYEKVCNGGSKVKWFVGIKGTKQKQMQGEMFELRSGFAYSLAQTPTRYGLMAFPFQINDQFIDLRVHQYKWEVEYQMIGLYTGYAILIAAAIGLVFLANLFLRKYFKRFTNSFKKIKYNTMTQQVGQSPKDVSK